MEGSVLNTGDGLFLGQGGNEDNTVITSREMTEPQRAVSHITIPQPNAAACNC